MRRKQTNERQGMFALRCSECDRLLTETPSGYLACPQGHGRLIRDEVEPVDVDEPAGMFDIEAA